MYNRTQLDCQGGAQNGETLEEKLCQAWAGTAGTKNQALAAQYKGVVSSQPGPRWKPR